jgi:hypothetical protein
MRRGVEKARHEDADVHGGSHCKTHRQWCVGQRSIPCGLSLCVGVALHVIPPDEIHIVEFCLYNSHRGNVPDSVGVCEWLTKSV